MSDLTGIAALIYGDKTAVQEEDRKDFIKCFSGVVCNVEPLVDAWLKRYNSINGHWHISDFEKPELKNLICDFNKMLLARVGEENCVKIVNGEFDGLYIMFDHETTKVCRDSEGKRFEYDVYLLKLSCGNELVLERRLENLVDVYVKHGDGYSPDPKYGKRAYAISVDTNNDFVGEPLDL